MSAVEAAIGVSKSSNLVGRARAALAKKDVREAQRLAQQAERHDVEAYREILKLLQKAFM